MGNPNNLALPYPKPLRLPIGNPSARADKYMTEQEAKDLFSCRVIVEEKMDGKYCHFLAENRFILFTEDLKVQHSIHYRVPARYVVFDVFDIKRDLFLDREEKQEVVENIRRGFLRVEDVPGASFILVPLIAAGKFSLKQIPTLPRMSVYAVDEETGTPTSMEGFVIKNNRPLFAVEFDTGKFIFKEFEEGISGHYIKNPLKLNVIDLSIPYIAGYH